MSGKTISRTSIEGSTYKVIFSTLTNAISGKNYLKNVLQDQFALLKKLSIDQTIPQIIDAISQIIDEAN
jgi:hypothetical protein